MCPSSCDILLAVRSLALALQGSWVAVRTTVAELMDLRTSPTLLDLFAIQNSMSGTWEKGEVQRPRVENGIPGSSCLIVNRHWSICITLSALGALYQLILQPHRLPDVFGLLVLHPNYVSLQEGHDSTLASCTGCDSEQG